MNTSSIEKSIKEETDRICKLTEKIISENKNNLVYDVTQIYWAMCLLDAEDISSL